MKAIIIRNNGGVENLVLADVAVPAIQPDEVLVKVKAISINPVDAALRNDNQRMTGMLNPAPDEQDHILGWDISGTVVETGKETTAWEGKDVFGMVNFPGQGRAYAEFVAAPVAHLAVKPANISHDEAAAATLAALTAWQALVTHAKIKQGEKVLIHAAAGGVGHFAVQIAAYFKAHVIGTASASNHDFVKALGAHEVLDYNTTAFEDKVNNADVILDSIEDKKHLAGSIQAMKPGGRLISIKSGFDEELNSMARQKQLFTIRMLVKSDGNDMQQLANLLEKGFLKSHISAVFNFEDMPKAHQQIETKRTRGKVIVRV